MNAHAAIHLEPTDPDSPSAWERALLDRQLQTLDRLAEMGMAMASAVQARATAPGASDAAVQHAAMDFARASRAVRMTLALQSKLVRDFKTPPKAGSAKAEDEDIEPGSLEVVWFDPDDPDAERKAYLQHAVKRSARDAGLDAETVERLAGEAGERLERDDIYGDIAARPFEDLLAQICRDLGLGPGQEIESGAEGAPLPAAQQQDDVQTPSPPSAPRVAEPTWLSG